METTTIRISPEMGKELGDVANRKREYITVLAQRAIGDFLDKDKKEQAAREKANKTK